MSSFVWNIKFLSAQIHLFLSAQIHLFCCILILVFAKAQHSRPFSAHPPKLLILQSAIPLEQAVDRTFSDKQLGRPTGRRHNRKTTPSFPHSLTFTFPWSNRVGAIVVVDLFSSLSHCVRAMRRRACFKCGSATLGHSSSFCFALFANVP